MKKILLTLGSMASVAAPLATTIACDEGMVLITAVSGEELTIAGFSSPKADVSTDAGLELYTSFLLRVGSEIDELEGKEDITKITLDGWSNEFQDNGSYLTTRIIQTIDLWNDFTKVSASNLQEAFDQTIDIPGFTKGATLFAGLLEASIAKAA